MKCPFCSHEETKVVDKRLSEDGRNRRRRECAKCGKRFTTYEKAEGLLTKVMKRDGSVAEFDREKITNAIWAAAQAVGGQDKETATHLSDKVVEKLEEKFGGFTVPTVEQIQDMVEKVLVEEGHYKTSKAYILYREQHKKLRETKSVMVDAVNTIGEYLNQTDWRVKENSNEAFSFSGLLLHTAGKVMSYYNLNQMYTPEISEAHKKGYMHIHDLSHGVIGYCCGHSLKNLLIMGFGGVKNKTECKPAKHLSTVIHQMVNYIGCLQMEFAGAQAFSSVDTLLAPFVRADNLSFRDVKQAMQQLVFSLNIPSRWGAQYPFSNITFDWVSPEDMKNQKAIVGGKEEDFTYSELQKEMDMINKAFLEVMLEGDAKGGVFTFPIPTYNLTKDFNWGSENAKLLFDLTAKYGLPYFQNYISSGLDPRSVRAMCLHPNEKIMARVGGNIRMFGIGELATKCASGFDESGWAKPSCVVEAISLNPNTLKFEWKPVQNFVRSAAKSMVTIRARDGKVIRVTPNHPVSVLTPDGVIEKPACSIFMGDFLLSIRSGTKCLSSTMQKIGAYDLDENMARLLGFFTADGNFLFENRKNMAAYRKPKGMQLTFPGKSDYAEGIIKLFEHKLGVKAKLKTDKRYGTLCAYFYNTEACRELSTAGLNKYGSVPPQLWGSPENVIRAFLGGFFLGDGYEKRGEIHINDEKLAEELVMLYHMAGQPVTLRKRENSQVITIQHSKQRKSSGLMGNPSMSQWVPSWGVNTGKVPGLNHNRGVSLQTLEYYGAHTPLTHLLMTGDVYPVRVVGVELSELNNEEHFYDIELAENHRFMHSLGTITHNCCRLNINQKELMTRPGGMWGPGDSTGSIGVVTINVNRLAYEARKAAEEAKEEDIAAKAKEEYLKKLGYYMVLAKNSLETKREVVEKNLASGLMPYTKRYLGTFRNHFSTIGLCGMNEACLNMLGRDIASPEGKQLAIETLQFMRGMCLQFQNETGSLYNLEATPAESTSYRMAKLDKQIHPDIITAGEKEPYLTNSTQLPVDYTDDPILAIEHQNDIQPLYTGGTIFHLFVGERLKDGETCKGIVRKVAENTKLPYFTITPTFSICPVHGYVKGEHFTCPAEIDATDEQQAVSAAIESDAKKGV